MFSDNIKYLRKIRGLSQAKLALELNINRSTLADYERGTYEPKIETLKVFSDYFKVSVDKLIDRKELEIKNSDNSFKVLAITVNDKGRENIEYISHKAYAGYLSGYEDPEYLITLPRFDLPDLTNGIFRAFEIKGDSMPPIDDGFIAIGQFVENWKGIKINERYILVTKDDGIVFKRIANISGNAIILSSDNSTYLPFTISFEDLLETWKFYAYIGFPGKALDNPLNTIFDKLNTISSRVDKLISNNINE